MATTETAVTKSVVIVLTALCVTRPVDTARHPVKYHYSLLTANHVRTNSQNGCFYTFYYVFFAASFQ